MKQHQFEQRHAVLWHQFEANLNRQEKLLHRLGKSERFHVDFPKNYRTICHHLALAKDRHYTPYLIERLNQLVLRGHQQLYSSHGHFLTDLLLFIGQDFPRLVRQEYRLMGVGVLLLFVSMICVALLTIQYPDFVFYILDNQMVVRVEWMYDPQSDKWGEERVASSNFAAFMFYIWNNVSISFRTFASGIFLGIGSIFALVFNGVFFGAITGHLINIGYSVPFFSFVSGHSALELTAIALSGGAGLKLGMAFLAPERYSRVQALKRAAGVSVRIMYGVAGMLVLAAFIEGFWSSLVLIDPFFKYCMGVLFWGVVILYFTLAGRNYGG
ncbi:uncharacterized membrane protein [Beggiatoa alba B18LD]|uniref:Uncharacterized membrane protein n=1 Tax=Beggiatoa alba B18LD TaxID=395493 RepID=I3CJ41_9GAMM|nr:stage II sporulation protein M [Beggiatoa alba]EIJ43634.1 uncharacterized membrane protein [Beggiatoa alba B18LD]